MAMRCAIRHNNILCGSAHAVQHVEYFGDDVYAPNMGSVMVPMCVTHRRIAKPNKTPKPAVAIAKTTLPVSVTAKPVVLLDQVGTIAPKKLAIAPTTPVVLVDQCCTIN
jgi:hypothetical protein